MKKFFLVLFVVVVVATLAFGRRYLIAAQVMPPGARSRTLLHEAFSPTYQKATPHLRLTTELNDVISPTVEASIGCDCTEPQVICCDNCPNAQTGPCTPYQCVQTSNQNSQCQTITNTYPTCDICPDAKRVACQP